MATIPKTMKTANRGSWLDRVIGFFSPIAGARRIAARHAINFLGSRMYEGASKGRRTKGWKATGADAESEISPALQTLVNRSRDLGRNSPWGNSAIETMTSDIVGTGILLSLSEKQLLDRWNQWADSTACDFLEQTNFYAIQELAMRTVIESGEVLVRRRRGSEDGKLVQLELLEADFLDTTKVDSKDPGRIRDGIEFEPDGKVKGYWVFKVHPGNNKILKPFRQESVFFPASEMKLLFRKTRAGQIRGVPWLAPVMMKLRDFEDYDDAQLVRQKIAACFVGFVKDSELPTTAATSTTPTKPIAETFEPGAFEVLPQGKDIVFGNPPGVGSDYDPYVRRALQTIAAGLGISYEALSGDLSQVNFSSARMGWIKYHRRIENWRWNTFIPGFCDLVFQWWLEGENVGRVGSKASAIPQWTPPRREMIDPTKEVPAMKDAIRAGLATLSDSVRQLGYDPEKHFLEVQKDFQKLDQLGLVLDSDPRQDKGKQEKTANAAENSLAEDVKK